MNQTGNTTGLTRKQRRWLIVLGALAFVGLCIGAFVGIPRAVSYAKGQIEAARVSAAAPEAEVEVAPEAEVEVAPEAEAEVAPEAEEPFDLVAVYSRELAKLLPESADRPYNTRGQDWVGGFTFTLEPDQYLVLFTSEGTLSAGGANYQITESSYRENAVVVHNKSDQKVDFTLTGFAPSGFAQWPYRLGNVPDVDEIIWSNVGQGDYCGNGNNTGCKDAVQHDLAFDGTAFNATTTVWDTPHAVADNAKPLRTAAWESVDLTSGWDTLMSNLSQPPAQVNVSSPDGLLYLGVTNGRDMVVWLPAGAVIIPPQGEPSAPLEKPAVVVLENRIGDTVIFKIAGITEPIQFLEFRKNATPSAAGEFLVRYTVGQPAARMFSASAAPTSEDAIDLLVFTNE